MRHPFLVVDENLFDKLDALPGFIQREIMKQPAWFTTEFLRTTPGGFARFIAFERERYRAEIGGNHPILQYGIMSSGLVWGLTNEGVLYAQKLTNKHEEQNARHWRLLEAYARARAARFEHGESPSF
jgi:hypothetical protein